MGISNNRLKIVLYGRNKCHLCDQVELAIQLLAEEFPLSLQLVDIESDQIVFRSITHVVTIEELREEFLKRMAD